TATPLKNHESRYFKAWARSGLKRIGRARNTVIANPSVEYSRTLLLTVTTKEGLQNLASIRLA
ncbi:hypothetical protein, partial [Klebsiella pneumoniae]|uniref:hypothetical protein n=1 Tax=Klebsiella pneumoniae TaxID=573 RepID=UPI0039C3E19D